MIYSYRNSAKGALVVDQNERVLLGVISVNLKDQTLQSHSPDCSSYETDIDPDSPDEYKVYDIKCKSLEVATFLNEKPLLFKAVL